MGQSTNAYLFYGYTWLEEGANIFGPEHDHEEEWEAILLTRRGVSKPWDLYRKFGAEAEHRDLPYKEQSAAYEAWKSENDFEAKLEVWYEQQRAVRAEFGVEVSSHCSGDYPLPFIHIKDAKFAAWRGDATEIDVQELAQAPTDEWNAELSRFVEELDIDLSKPEYGEAPKGPGWFLVSYWG